MGHCRASQWSLKCKLKGYPTGPLHSFLVQNSTNRKYVQEMGCIDSISNDTCHNAGRVRHLTGVEHVPVQHVWADIFQLLDPDRKSAKSRHEQPVLGAN